MTEGQDKDVMRKSYDRSVLIVDRNAAMRESLAEDLRQEGWWATGCGDGRSAERAAGLVLYDVVLIDFATFNIPSADGRNIAERLRRLNPHVYIIGTGFPDQRSAFLDGGADGFLQKPFAGDMVRKMSASTVPGRSGKV